MTRSLPCLLIAVAFSYYPLCAQSVWDGGAGTSLWSDAANWSPNGVPSSSAAVQFTGTGPYAISLSGNRTALSLLFGGTSGYTLSGNTLTISSGTISLLSPVSGAVTHTIASNVTLGSAGGISTAANTTLSLTGTTTGSALSKSGDGTLILGGTSAFSGLVSVAGGTLQVGNGGTAGAISGTMNVSSGAAVVFKRSDAYTIDTTISGSGNVIQNGGSTLRFTTDQTFTGTL